MHDRAVHIPDVTSGLRVFGGGLMPVMAGWGAALLPGRGRSGVRLAMFGQVIQCDELKRGNT